MKEIEGISLNRNEVSILLQIIYQSRFTPDEWENSVKPIVEKLKRLIEGGEL